MNLLWLHLEHVDLETELLQAEQEGRELATCRQEFHDLAAADLSIASNQLRAQRLLDDIQQLPFRSDYQYVEPESCDCDSTEIFTVQGYEAKVHAAWLGRCCGCLLGKPIEGWMRAALDDFLKENRQGPLQFYMESQSPEHSKLPFLNNVRGMPEDDDLNYTVASLAIAKEYGLSFSSENVAEFWLKSLPLLHTCTAERVAYRNFTNGVMPPQSAVYRNPYREWIGAQIRADFWGYVNPGNPAAAALMAWKDARISHIKNGVFGAMWVAAMIAAAFAFSDAKSIIETGLRQIPKRSRLTEAIGRQLAMYEAGFSAARAIDDIHSRWKESRAHDWCHVISNAEIVAMALLHGQMDFGKAICLAVSACFDTDCNGATVGSIIGAANGAIPENWAKPLNNHLETGIQGFHSVTISAMADATIGVYNANN